MTTDTSSPKAQLERLGLRPKRSFGQNFLADAHLCGRIAALATTPPGGVVAEIGSGLGALTAPLLERAARVYAIERDRELLPALAERHAEAMASARLTLLEADAKTVNVGGLLAEGPRPRVLAGNLPYQITGPLLERAAALARQLERCVFLVQLEVADRIVAAPGSKTYGALSVFLQAQYAVERAFVVRRGAFYPQPGVDSAVVVLDPLELPIAEETAAFRAVVRAAFGQRRKTLRNAWSGLDFGASTDLESAARRAGIDLGARGESLSPAAFGRMAAELGR
jgi:16S rRNA (adenine1518-N6/adenine1519-N6)-dimethyltransferase